MNIVRPSLISTGIKTLQKHSFLRLLSSSNKPQKTDLYDLHKSLGGQMVEFCGWSLPVKYRDEVIESHCHTRTACSLFDVGHMGQVEFRGKDREEFIEWVTPGDVLALQPNQARLSSFTNFNGGLIDDCMYTQRGDHIYMVINAANTEKDLNHLRARAKEFKQKGKDVIIDHITDKALIALQGPLASKVLQNFVKIDLSKFYFMHGCNVKVDGIDCGVTRCGYTGEDGFEISIPSKYAQSIASMLLEDLDVKPAGLAPRDTLRLESGLCLYGNDIDDMTSPTEAGLLWTITKRRRNEGGFIGFDKIFSAPGQTIPIKRKRVGFIVPVGGMIAREHTSILDSDDKIIGEVTSGSFAPSLKHPLGQCYLPIALAKPGQQITLFVRNKKKQIATVSKMPFVPAGYYTKPK